MLTQRHRPKLLRWAHLNPCDSVRQYLDDLEEDDQSDRTMAVVNALRNYGHYVQPYLRRLYSSLVYTEMPAATENNYGTVSAAAAASWDLTGFEHDSRLNSALVKSVSIRLNVNSGTDLVFELKLTKEAEGMEVMARVDNDADYSTVPINSRGVYRIARKGIAPNNLECQFRFDVMVGGTEAFSVTASVMDYISLVLSNSCEEDEQYALAALFKYWEATNEY